VKATVLQLVILRDSLYLSTYVFSFYEIENIFVKVQVHSLVSLSTIRFTDASVNTPREHLNFLAARSSAFSLCFSFNPQFTLQPTAIVITIMEESMVF
jgi:hypothetical protein